MADLPSIQISKLPTAGVVSEQDILIVNQVSGTDRITRRATVGQVFSDSIEDATAAAKAAEKARDEAEAFASQAESAAENEATFPTVAAGLAGTTSGQYFRVPQGTGSDISFIYYLNNAGTAVAVAETVGASAIRTQAEKIAEVDARTKGLNTYEGENGETAFVDADGRVSFLINKNGDKTMYGKSNMTDVDVSTRLGIDKTEMLSAEESGYLWAQVDKDFKCVGGLRTDGKWEFYGKVFTGEQDLQASMKNKVWGLGDSLTANGWSTNDQGASIPPYTNAKSWHTWGMAYSNGKIRYTGQSALGGITSAQIISGGYLAQALVSGADYCVVLCGRNDVNLGVNIDTVTIPSMITIFTQLQAAGITPIVCTMAAQSISDPVAYPGQRARETRINSWLRAYASSHGLPFVDMHQATVNPLTGNWKPGYNQDVSHPTELGAKVMGKTFADTMSQWLAPSYPDSAQSISDPATSANKAVNPLFLDVTGGLPTAWTVDIPANASIITDDTTIIGNAFKLTSPTGTTKAYQDITVAPNKKMGITFKFKVTDRVTGGLGYAFIEDRTNPAAIVRLGGVNRWAHEDPNFLYYHFDFTTGATTTTLRMNLQGFTCSMYLAELSVHTIDTTGY